ncbi:hypothetical protein POSPLADRAFT_1154005 [Postia placenta MAD-698-R-SB12]|uniref:Peptidase A1 domain-containing protein n=1 Tax=Postia placenta MAD-698-R-SB12 TaxID=670580 RepID=A0A1X6MQD1_9APHY|nr:hypothetical protein POSPLADRAFT_1154005 [Postia placenta MAD-698-R-SB12]OSX58416.1 hypothetical protein POSPLADRAFT_1154005 [Postia placenta MAD-698-R-SB12]
MLTRSSLLLQVLLLLGSTTGIPIGTPDLLSTAPGGYLLQSSPIPLPFTRLINPNRKAQLPQADRQRFQSLYGNAQGSTPDQEAAVFNVPSTFQVVSYVATVGIGNPPTNYSLLIDTGSSNTWVGANKTFESTSSTIPTGGLFSVEYGSGFVAGFEVEDVVTLAYELTIKNQSIGVAVFAEGFDGVDGILGIGPVDLTQGTNVPNINEKTSTVTDNAWFQGLLAAYEVGIGFAPADNGELTFGGTNPTRYTGNINYVPITSTKPAGNFVGINQTVSYGGVEILHNAAGIVDTGTTLLLLATDAFNMYKAQTGATLDERSGLLKVTPEQYGQMNSLYFDIGGRRYELTPNAQIWPRTLNEEIGGDKDGIYLVVADSGNAAGSGLDFIDGMVFLERYYLVYDVGNSLVGFATTTNTYSNVN